MTVVLRYSDNGKKWTNVTPKDLPPGGRVQYIDASPHRKGSAYFAVYRWLLGAINLHLPHQRLRQHLDQANRRQERHPADWAHARGARNPDREGLLYAGTSLGCYLLDSGAHGSRFREPAERTRVRHQSSSQGLDCSTQGQSDLDPRQSTSRISSRRR